MPYASGSWPARSRRRDIRVILLAAGRGSRLQPLTDAQPKCLLPVGGVPLLTRAVGQLAAAGLRDFTIVAGYRGDMVRDALTADHPAELFRFVRNEEWETTGNAWSLHLAAPTPAEETKPIFILDSDIVFDPGVIERLLSALEPNRLALRTRGEIGAEEMKVRLDAQGLVADISKELAPADSAGESVGLEIFAAPAAARLFEILAERGRAGNGRTEFYEAAFVALIQSGTPIHPVDLGDLRCLEIDTADDLIRADRLFQVPA